MSGKFPKLPEGTRTPGRTGGRQAGTPNKIPARLKDLILESLSSVGGAAYLAEQAILNPGPYLALIGKVLPLQVTGENGAPLVVQISRDDSAL